ncbi:hypothetical protein VKT23_008508 [Stygiomarasmius scandens]|uniref:Aminoglycoside phosphotransferase domain-containing protein n=1 Tax=Marasmiellus scandens TaxID=2682957 RepID=A0ABR1JGL9_9AGAR
MIFGKHQYRLSLTWSEWLRFLGLKGAAKPVDAFLLLQSLIAPAKRLPEKPLPIDASALDKLFGRPESQWLQEVEDSTGVHVMRKYGLAVKSCPLEALRQFGTEDELLCPEVLAMQLARKHTSIPVPRVHRVLPTEVEPELHWIGGTTNYWLVMHYIPGELLGIVWPRLSIWRKLWVVITLCRYVKELRKVLQPFDGHLGRISTDGEPLRCDLPGLFERSEKFSSYDALKTDYNNRWKSRGEDGRSCYADPNPLAFIHGDLHKFNIILGEDGQLWLIDWGYSGFYPRWFEYRRMFIMGSFQKVDGRVIQFQDHTWQLLAGIICDYDPWTLAWYRQLYNVCRNVRQ